MLEVECNSSEFEILHDEHDNNIDGLDGEKHKEDHRQACDFAFNLESAIDS